MTLKKDLRRITLVVAAVLGTVHCYTLQNVTALRATLFQNYDKISRPMLDQSVPTVVRMGLSVYVIYDVQEVTQSIKLSASLKISWLDENLMWSPSDYDGIEVGVYPQEFLWRPGVALKNSVEDYKTLGDPSLNVEVTHDGVVTWEPYQIFTSRCTFDITFFPFDNQTCDLVFVTWGYMASDVTIEALDPAVDMSDLTTNPEWNIEKIDSEALTHPRPMMVYHIRLVRKPRYVLMSVVLPLMVLMSLNIVAFLVPADGGERLGFAITVFLSFVVFATIVQDTLPANSENLCILYVYILTQVVESTIGTVIAVIFARLVTRDDAPGDLVTSIVSVCTCWRVTGGAGDDDRGDEHGWEEPQHPPNTSNKVAPEQVDENGSENRSKSCDKVPVKPDWKSLVHRLDMVLFCVCLFVNVLITITFFGLVTS